MKEEERQALSSKNLGKWRGEDKEGTQLPVQNTVSQQSTWMDLKGLSGSLN